MLFANTNIAAVVLRAAATCIMAAVTASQDLRVIDATTGGRTASVLVALLLLILYPQMNTVPNRCRPTGSIDDRQMLPV